MKRRITHKVDAEDTGEIDLVSPKFHKMRIIAPLYEGGPVGLYYVESNGSTSEGGEFDADLFMEHMMAFYHKHF